MERGLELPGFPPRPYQVFEASMPFVLRYMIDRDITGCCWLEMPKNTYRIRPRAEHVSLCQLEVDIVYDSLVSHKPDGARGWQGAGAASLSPPPFPPLPTRTGHSPGAVPAPRGPLSCAPTAAVCQRSHRVRMCVCMCVCALLRRRVAAHRALPHPVV